MKLIDKQDKIIKLYEIDRMSIREIANSIGCSYSGVSRILNANNVKMRNKCESLNLTPNDFSDEEKSLVLGTVLGDGHITRRRGKNGECQLLVGHGVKQTEYLLWKYNIMHRFVSGRTYKLNHYIYSYKSHHQTINFITKKSFLFTQFRDMFYDNEGCKRLPNNFEDEINNFSLSVWYMDDGYKYKNKKSAELHTQNFCHEDQIRIVDVLKNKFEIDSNIRKLSTGNYIIFIPSRSFEKMSAIVDSNIVPCLEYKRLIPNDREARDAI